MPETTETTSIATPEASAGKDAGSSDATPKAAPQTNSELESLRKALHDTKAELTRVTQSVPKEVRERLEKLGERRDVVLDLAHRLTPEDIAAIQNDLQERERQAVQAKYGEGVPETVVSELEAVKRQLEEMRAQSQRSAQEQLAAQQATTMDYLTSRISSTGANDYVSKLITMEAQSRLYQVSPQMVAPQHVVDKIVSDTISDFKAHNLIPAEKTKAAAPDGLDGGTGIPTTAGPEARLPGTRAELLDSFHKHMS